MVEYIIIHRHKCAQTCTHTGLLTHKRMLACAHTRTPTHLHTYMRTHVYIDPHMLSHTATLISVFLVSTGWRLPLSPSSGPPCPMAGSASLQAPIQKALSLLLLCLSFVYIVLLLPSGGAQLGRIRGPLGWSNVITQPFSATLEPGPLRLLLGRLRAAHPAVLLTALVMGWKWCLLPPHWCPPREAKKRNSPAIPKPLCHSCKCSQYAHLNSDSWSFPL